MSDHHVRAGLDILAAGTVLGAWSEYLPAIMATLGGIWYATQIFEWVVGKLKKKQDPK
jgi:hypothetical protein